MLYCRSKRESKQGKANPVFTEGLGGGGGSNVGPDEDCGTHLNPCSVPALGHGSSPLPQHSCQGLSGYWQPGSVPRAQSLQRGSSLREGGCESQLQPPWALVALLFLPEAAEEGLELAVPCSLPSQEPGEAAWVTAWHLELRRVVLSPRHSFTLCRAMGLPDPVPLVQLDTGSVGGCFSSAEQLGKPWIAQ